MLTELLLCQKRLTPYILIISSFPVFAQVSQEQFVHFDVADGLPSKVVYSVQQDSSGFIWVSTDAGIAYYDGYSFTTLTTKDGLPNNDVIDADYLEGRLWVNTLGPLSYISSDFNIHPAPISPPDFSSFIDHQFATDDTTIWISRANTLFRLSKKSLSPLSVNPDLLRGDSTDCWVFNHNGQPWMLRKKIGHPTELLQIAGNRINKSFIVGPPGKHIYFFFHASKGKYLYCQFDGDIVAIDTTTGKVYKLVGKKGLASRIVVNDQELWVVQPRNGIETYTLLDDTTARYKATLLEGAQPSGLLMDQEGNSWVGTLGNGLFFLPRQTSAIGVLQKSNGLSENTISSVITSGRYVIAGNRSNLVEFFEFDQEDHLQYLKRRKLKDQPNYSITNRILRMVSPAPGTFLIAADIGLVYWTEDQEQLLLQESIKNLSLSPDGDLLISSHRGVRKLAASQLDRLAIANQKNISYSSLFEEVVKGRSYASTVDPKGHIWAHTIADGLLQITPADTIYWKEKDPVFSAQVIDMAVLADSTVCLGTRGHGLVLIKNNEYRILDQKMLLASDFINNFYKDKYGGLWIGTNKGLTHWATPNFDTLKPSLITYSQSDGLLSNNINDITVWNEQVIVATNDGLMYFNPDNIIETSKPPKLVLYPTKVNDTLIIESGSAQLAHDENNIQFRFAALNFRDRNTTTFLYRLKGLNDSWQSTKAPIVHYVGLKPGKYTFELKAVTDKGLVSQLGTPFVFKIEQTFIQSSIFYWLLWIAGFTLILFMFQNINRKLKNKELNRLVKEKTQELETQNQALEESNSKLRRSNQELNQFAYIAAHDLKSPLRSISSFVQLLRRRALNRLTEEELEYIEFAVKGTQQLGKLIDDLQAYSQITGRARERTWNETTDLVDSVAAQIPVLSEEGVLQVESDLPKIWMNTQNGQLLFHHLLSNAVKFRHPDRALRIEIGKEKADRETVIFVKDNGIGIHPQYQEKIFKIFQRLHTSDKYPGTGIGLAISKKVIEEDGGRIWLSSEEGEGATFYFTCKN